MLIVGLESNVQIHKSMFHSVTPRLQICTTISTDQRNHLTQDENKRNVIHNARNLNQNVLKHCVDIIMFL